MLNIYRISQTVNDGYDTYSDAVVVAKRMKEAQVMHPAGSNYVWDKKRGWLLQGKFESCTGDWAPANQVKVEKIGRTNIIKEPCIVLASFHAG